MATTLPPISRNRNSSIKSDKTNSEEQLKLGKNYAEKSTYDRVQELRSQLPVLRKQDIAQFRNSYNHNLCLEMLTAGFHMSFCELINLIRQQREAREAAGTESYLWAQPVLENQPEKLDKLKFYLTKAETASRLGNTEDEYYARYDLAQYFKENPQDQWLVDHFFSTCLDVAKKDGQETKLLAEGYCNVGLCFQLNQEHKEAVKFFEAYHKLAKNNKDWKMANGNTFYNDSCIKLYHIYTIFGLELGRIGEEEDHKASLVMLKQALEMAKNGEEKIEKMKKMLNENVTVRDQHNQNLRLELKKAIQNKNSHDKKLEGEASYALGMAYQKTNQLDVAFSHLMTFFESCQGDSDSEGTGRACDAIAKIFARQGNKEKSVEFLKRFVELTEKTGLEKEYCLACHNLGSVCNSVGNYNEATEYFSKAYNISRALGDTESTNINRVQYGIGSAHRMLEKFSNHVTIADALCVSRLLEWKSVRTDDFSKPIPDAAPGAEYHVLLAKPLDERMEESRGSQGKSTGGEGSSIQLEEEQHLSSASEN